MLRLAQGPVHWAQEGFVVLVRQVLVLLHPTLTCQEYSLFR
jgi:hypothetical protein